MSAKCGRLPPCKLSTKLAQAITVGNDRLQIQDFEYLLAVAEHASIGRAAEALGLSQPALTKAIRRLEVDAGLPLFVRSAKGMLPTEAGQAFLRRGRNIWLGYEDAMREMQHMRSGQLGRLRVGFSPSVAGELVVGALRQLVVERPAAQLQLRERLVSGLIDLLLAGELDLILAPATEAIRQSALDFLPLYSDQFRVISDRNHRLQKRRSLSVADVAQEQWILPSRDVYVRQWIDEEYRKRSLDGPQVRIEAEFGQVSMWPLVHDSQLLTLCNAGHLAEARRFGLETLPLPELNIDRQIGVIARSDSWRSPLAERLTQLLQAEVARNKGKLRTSRQI